MCHHSTTDCMQPLLCERNLYLLVYTVRQVPNYRSRKHCSSRTMATQLDEPTQPTPSANSENFYIIEADQIVVNNLLSPVQHRCYTYAESVTRGRRQPNKNGRHASLTTTQTDSAMIRGNGTSSNIRSANTKRRASTSKARKQVGVFITQLARSTNPKDLATHVKRKTGLSVSCEPLRTKFDTYSSFCVRLPPRDQHLLLDSRVWPSGVMVRAFLE